MTMTYPGRRRTVSAAAAIIAAGTVLAACSSGSSGAGGGSTNASTVALGASASGAITVSYHTEAAGANPMQVVINSFEKKYPKIKVKLATSATDTYPQLLLTQLGSGNGPDVFWVSGGTGESKAVLNLAKRGFVAPISQYSWAGAAIPAGQQSLFVTGGKQYGLPISFEVDTMVVNQTALKQKTGLAAMPDTLSGLLAACSQAASAGSSLFNVAGSAAPNVSEFIFSIAASYVYSQDPDWNAQRAAGTVKFSGSPLWTAALNVVSQLKSKGCLQDGAAGGSISALFPAVATGKSMALFAPTFVASELQSLAGSNTYEAAAFPAATAAGTRVSAEAADAMAVNAKSKNKAAALTFLEFLTQPSIQDLYAQIDGGTSLTTFKTGNFTGILAPIASLLTSHKFVPTGDVLWPNANVSTALTTGVVGLLTGQTSIAAVESAMDSAWTQP